MIEFILNSNKRKKFESGERISLTKSQEKVTTDWNHWKSVEFACVSMILSESQCFSVTLCNYTIPNDFCSSVNHKSVVTPLKKSRNG